MTRNCLIPGLRWGGGTVLNVPVGDAREREHTTVGESGPRAPNCR
jgi:hypothetical protein